MLRWFVAGSRAVGIKVDLMGFWNEGIPYLFLFVQTSEISHERYAVFVLWR